ncbi:MAG: YndJ family transporter, partial [Saprospiraceae bacterium]
MYVTISHRNIIVIGTVIWLILLIVQFTTFYQEAWARLILALAALVWLPLALPLVSTRNVLLEQLLYHLLLPAAALLAFALFLPAGSIAALFTLPWFLFTLLISLRGIIYFSQNAQSPPAVLAIAAAHVFLSIGGAWTLADRLGWQPLGFDPAIVLLTGVHFHYAGFIFP